MDSLDLDTLKPYLLALLVSGGVGGSIMAHTHPEIIVEIRKVQYEDTLERAKIVMDNVEDKSTSDYVVAQAQVVKYTQKLADLE